MRALEEAADKASDGLPATAVGGAAPATAPVGTSAGRLTGSASTATGPTEGFLDPEAPPATSLPLGPGDAGTVCPDPWADYGELAPEGFEQAVAELCARDGCLEVDVVGGAGDLGADVVAITADGRRLVIQCKQYGESHKVGSQDVQRFGGTCYAIHEADIAALITTSKFTTPALDYAQQCGILCMSGDELDAWRQGIGPTPWDRTRIGP
ncbi:restriction endonuclease [Streptomyces sp. NPDC059165]|uniref:restriction endonuclease n=1 Tax=Streptomyces sp. NPDC059165 TaxID=3346751 RepID=UPI003688E6AE